jgi:hypothetical protein
MKIQRWSIDKVISYKRNPRRNDEAVDKVAASIKEFGFKQPILADKESVISDPEEACAAEYREVFAFWLPPAMTKGDRGQEPAKG